MMINLYKKKTVETRCQQPIKCFNNGGWNFQGIYEVYKTMIDMPDVEMLVGAHLEGMFRSNILDLPRFYLAFFTLLLVSPIQHIYTW